MDVVMPGTCSRNLGTAGVSPGLFQGHRLSKSHCEIPLLTCKDYPNVTFSSFFLGLSSALKQDHHLCSLLENVNQRALYPADFFKRGHIYTIRISKDVTLTDSLNNVNCPHFDGAQQKALQHSPSLHAQL